MTEVGTADAMQRVFRSTPLERIEQIRSGIPAHIIQDLSTAMGVSKRWLMKLLELSYTNVNRKVKTNKLLSREETERIIGVIALIGQVQAMLMDVPGAEGFDAARWVAQWLSSPLPALGGKTPGSFMDTIEGQRMIATLVSMMQSGAYA